MVQDSTCILHKMIHSGVDLIKEHYYKIKNQVDIEAEVRIDEIKDKLTSKERIKELNKIRDKMKHSTF